MALACEARGTISPNSHPQRSERAVPCPDRDRKSIGDDPNVSGSDLTDGVPSQGDKESPEGFVPHRSCLA